MMRALQLVRLFFRVCWHRGIRTAWLMAAEKLAPRRRLGSRRSPFEYGRSNAAAYLSALKKKPLITVVVPVLDSPYLDETIASVTAQSYPHFELILVDDASGDPAAQACRSAAARDERIRCLRNDTNRGISRATNRGCAAARGEYIALLDHDDLLHPDALAQVARAANAHPEADILFTDELRIGPRGAVLEITRKCDPSETLLLSCNSILHLCVMRKSAFENLGGMDPAFDGAQDHDLMLRAFDGGLAFQHIPCVLYAWRIHGRSMSHASARTPQDRTASPAYRAGKACIEAYLARKGIEASVTDEARPWYRVRFAVPRPDERVAVVVPFKDGGPLLERLLAGLRKTLTPGVRIYLVDNASSLPETREFLDGLAQDPAIRILSHDRPFNFSRLHNEIVAGLDEEILVFLNNDVEVISEDWLSAMREHVHRDRVAAVGCALRRRNGDLAHAGIVLQLSNREPCARNLAFERGFYTRVQREVSAVSAACMMVRRSAFLAVGGFDETEFPVGFSDVDLCLRLGKAGYRIVYTPHAEFYHDESASRGVCCEDYETGALLQRYLGDSPVLDRHYKTVW